MPLTLQFCILDLFADDATLSSSDSSILKLTSSLNDDLENFMNWCTSNDMLVNVPKTKAMLISTKPKLNQIMSHPPILKIGNETINNSNVVGTVFLDLSKVEWFLPYMGVAAILVM